MCGIVGLFNRSGPVRVAALETALARLAHRGPDDQGTFVSGHFGMGHTRLSIIDLAGGHQPLKSADGGLTLIANGEIYNFIELRALLEARGHRFLTHSDCEVILHAYREYGENFLEHILGMFAFALFDSVHDRLILARDRLGIKPLFLAEGSRGVAFASEIKGLLPLLDSPPGIDALGLAPLSPDPVCHGGGHPAARGGAGVAGGKRLDRAGPHRAPLPLLVTPPGTTPGPGFRGGIDPLRCPHGVGHHRTYAFGCPLWTLPVRGAWTPPSYWPS
jgi:asparagine synthetase B (glutamine-hydrolysing)